MRVPRSHLTPVLCTDFGGDVSKRPVHWHLSLSLKTVLLDVLMRRWCLIYGILGRLFPSSWPPLWRPLLLMIQPLRWGDIHRGWSFCYCRQSIYFIKKESWCFPWKFYGKGRRMVTVALLSGVLVFAVYNLQQSWHPPWPWQVGHWWIPGAVTSATTLFLLNLGPYITILERPPYIHSGPSGIWRGWGIVPW